MHRTTQALLWASCFILGVGVHDAAHSRDRSVGVSIGGTNGINAGVSVGTKNGVDADVSASVGGRKGVNADVGANVGKGVDADVDASLGDRKSTDVGADVSVGDDQGVDAKVNVDLSGTDTKVGTPTVLHPDIPDVTDKSPNNNPDGTSLTAEQRQAFDNMSDSQKKAMLKRCQSIGSGGYDPALVNLCKLLRMSASR
jgi:hypothetical protein